MLNTLRKGAATWIAKIFIGLLVLSFAVWGVADIFGGYGQSTVATVGDIKISAEEYQRAFQSEIRAFSARMQRVLSTEEARNLGLDARVLDQLVTNAALDRHATELNLGISDKAILGAITKERAFQDSSGSFSRIAFEQVLRSNGLSEAGFVLGRRQDSVRQQIIETLTRDISAPKALLTATERYIKAKRTMSYFVLPTSATGEIEKPEDAKLRAYYDSHRHQFTAPEYRKLALLVLSPETLKESIKIPEEDVKAAYKAAEHRYTTPERRHVLQIAFSDLPEAEKAFASLKSGKNFAEVAKEKGFSETDIDLGNLSREGISDEKIREAAFALKTDEFSEPIEGSLSTVIIKVIKIEPEVVKKFEDVKSDLRGQLALEKGRNKALDLHDAIEDARASGATFKEISAQHNIKFLEIAAVDRSGNAPGNKEIKGIPGFNVVVRAAFASDVGVENDPVDAGNGDFVWFDVADVTGSKLKLFETIKSEAAEKWKENEVRSRMAKKSTEVLKNLRDGKSLEEAAKTFKADVKQTKSLTRGATSEDLTAAAIGQAFALAKDGFGSARAKSGEERLIFQVTKIELPEKLDEKEAEKLMQQMVPQLARDLFAQYLIGLQKAYSVNVNQSTYNILTGREQTPINSSRRSSF